MERYNGEVPTPPPLTSLPVMALLQIHRGGGGLALLACIQPLVTLQITLHLLRFGICGRFCCFEIDGLVVPVCIKTLQSNLDLF